MNVDDLLALINAWGNSTSNADINGDGIVSLPDLTMLIENWTVY